MHFQLCYIFEKSQFHVFWKNSISYASSGQTVMWKMTAYWSSCYDNFAKMRYLIAFFKGNSTFSWKFTFSFGAVSGLFLRDFVRLLCHIFVFFVYFVYFVYLYVYFAYFMRFLCIYQALFSETACLRRFGDLKKTTFLDLYQACALCRVPAALRRPQKNDIPEFLGVYQQ